MAYTMLIPTVAQADSARRDIVRLVSMVPLYAQLATTADPNGAVETDDMPVHDCPR